MLAEDREELQPLKLGMCLLVEACSMQKCRSVVGYAVLLAILLSKLMFVCARERVFVNGKALMLLCVAGGLRIH
jgi:hypothetical protein